LDRYFKRGINFAGIKRRGFTLGSSSVRKSGKGAGEITIDPYLTRNVQERNGSKAFVAKEGDTYEQIAQEFSMKEWEIYKYNDCEKGSKPEVNSVVYIHSKRGKAPKGNDYHLAKEGESLWSIAQWYGVRLNALYRINRMKKGEEPQSGQRISLRKRIKR
jgi:LysM repeat protein